MKTKDEVLQAAQQQAQTRSKKEGDEREQILHDRAFRMSWYVGGTAAIVVTILAVCTDTVWTNVMAVLAIMEAGYFWFLYSQLRKAKQLRIAIVITVVGVVLLAVYICQVFGVLL